MTGPRIVCLCGSTRFRQAWIDAHRERSLAGEIVLSVGVMIHAGAEPIRDDGPEKRTLDELHLRKIDIADYVLVLNVDGYVGDSTRREIAYAESIEKPVEYLTDSAAVETPAPWDGPFPRGERWIGVDLDGTLAYHEAGTDPGVVGAPVPAMLERVLAWRARHLSGASRAARKALLRLSHMAADLSDRCRWCDGLADEHSADCPTSIARVAIGRP